MRRRIIALIETPLAVDLGVKRETFHHERREETDARDADHDLPDDTDTEGVCSLDLRAERLFKRRNNGDDREREINATWELSEEFLGKFLL